MYELTKFGPTAFNSQPLRVTYVRSDEARAKLVDALMPGNRAKTASAPLVAILSYDTDWAGQWDNFLPGYNAPKAMYDANPELAAATGNNNAHLQAGYFILAVRSLGFAAGPMTGADFGAIDEAFFPAGDQKSFLVVNIGQPAEDAWGEAKPKFAYEDVVRTV
nr:malonic semialdehyde reductase [Arthrobacter sp. P2b]